MFVSTCRRVRRWRCPWMQLKKLHSFTHIHVHPSIHPSMDWCDVVAKPLCLATVSLLARCGKQLQRLPLSTRGRKVGGSNPPGEPQRLFCVEFVCSPRACVGSLHVPFHPPPTRRHVCLGEGWKGHVNVTSGVSRGLIDNLHISQPTSTATLLGPPQFQLGAHCLITCALMSGGITAELWRSCSWNSAESSHQTHSTYGRQMCVRRRVSHLLAL